MKKHIINFLIKLSPFYEKQNVMYGYAELSENGDNYKWVSENETKTKHDKIEKTYSIIRFFLYGIIWLIIGVIIS